MVYVKHDAWNEFGKGYVVSFPIRIVEPPLVMHLPQPFGAPSPLLQQPQQPILPASWEPVVIEGIAIGANGEQDTQSFEPVRVALPQDEMQRMKMSVYQTEVMIPMQETWEANASPRVEEVFMDERESMYEPQDAQSHYL